jgi:hypothetical protein
VEQLTEHLASEGRTLDSPAPFLSFADNDGSHLFHNLPRAGVGIDNWPTVGNVELDMRRFYELVRDIGGCEAVEDMDVVS